MRGTNAMCPLWSLVITSTSMTHGANRLMRSCMPLYIPFTRSRFCNNIIGVPTLWDSQWRGQPLDLRRLRYSTGMKSAHVRSMIEFVLKYVRSLLGINFKISSLISIISWLCRARMARLTKNSRPAIWSLLRMPGYTWLMKSARPLSYCPLVAVNTRLMIMLGGHCTYPSSTHWKRNSPKAISNLERVWPPNFSHVTCPLTLVRMLIVRR